uniref:Phage shock protein PspC N-terminal domain-containing protein n=1 Tax=uncultured Dehalococcoidia bacterium TaxID=498747 RepID=A0A871XZA3_9CHLR|nr:hypothetical protein HULAa30F3_00018 [uncultured Dehalococcoidia bacterium]
MQQPTHKRLYRSNDDRILTGVCGGLAKYFNIDPVLIRVLTVLIALVTSGVGIIAYILLAIIVPVENSTAPTPRDVVRENAEDLKQTATKIGEEIKTAAENHHSSAQSANDRTGLIIGLALICIGVIALLATLGVFDVIKWFVLWPAILIIIGILILIGVWKR